MKICKDTGHVRQLKLLLILKTNYANLLNVFGKNIDPLINMGNFVIKGKVIGL